MKVDHSLILKTLKTLPSFMRRICSTERFCIIIACIAISSALIWVRAPTVLVSSLSTSVDSHLIFTKFIATPVEGIHSY